MESPSIPYRLNIMNVYELLDSVLEQDRKNSDIPQYDDHPATIDGDMRDAFIYIRISGKAIAVRPDGSAFFL